MSDSCDEYYSVYNETRFKARKEHRCDACKEPIPSGVQYTRVFLIFDGGKESLKRCGRCQMIHEHLRELCQSRADGEMWPDERLNCGHSYRDHWEEDPPPFIAALAFWRPGDPLPALNECDGPWERRLDVECRQYGKATRHLQYNGARCRRPDLSDRPHTETCS